MKAPSLAAFALVSWVVLAPRAARADDPTPPRPTYVAPRIIYPNGVGHQSRSKPAELMVGGGILVTVGVGAIVGSVVVWAYDMFGEPHGIQGLYTAVIGLPLLVVGLGLTIGGSVMIAVGSNRSQYASAVPAVVVTGTGGALRWTF